MTNTNCVVVCAVVVWAVVGVAGLGALAATERTSPAAGAGSVQTRAAGESSRAGAAGAPANLLFFDGFEYEVKRDEINERPAFLTEGKWSGVKSINAGRRGAYGYLYTVDRIPGYKGKFPGQNSRRVLAIEARPRTFNTQTDFYLQFGDPRGPADQVPGNVWFQFWMYINHYNDPDDKEDQISGFERSDKFIYPSPDGNYPTWPVWLFCVGRTSHVMLKDRDKPFMAEAPSHDLLLQLVTGSRDENRNFCAYAEIKKAPSWDQFKLGQTSLDERIVANRWTLVRLHIDTSTSSGKYEAWLRPLGGKEVKVAEWIDGVTEDFAWKIPEQKIGGYRVFRMPTTIGSFGDRAKNNQDCWIYLDDFAMATSAGALPKYPE